MKTILGIFFIVMSISFAWNKKKNKQAAPPLYEANQLIDPKIVADQIVAHDTNIIIINTGPVDDIKGAITIGPVEQDKYLNKFIETVDTLNRDKTIYIYCGCCPLAVCPNLKPAYNVLKEKQFKTFKIINMVEGIDEDWISKGYPTSGY